MKHKTSLNIETFLQLRRTLVYHVKDKLVTDDSRRTILTTTSLSCMSRWFNDSTKWLSFAVLLWPFYLNSCGTKQILKALLFFDETTWQPQGFLSRINQFIIDGIASKSFDFVWNVVTFYCIFCTFNTFERIKLHKLESSFMVILSCIFEK